MNRDDSNVDSRDITYYYRLGGKSEDRFKELRGDEIYRNWWQLVIRQPVVVTTD
jgi:hypothetical protein